MGGDVLTKEETGLIRTPVGTFELVEEFRNGWNPEAFKERYSDILDKYDYVVGDWGYGQLRLRGFYDSSNRRVPLEQRIATLDEYLHEFCNFGCAYFVLRRVKTGLEVPPVTDADDSAETAVPSDETQVEWRSTRGESPERRTRQHDRDDQRHLRTNRPHASPPRQERERGESRPERHPRGGGPNRSEGKGHPPRGDRGKRHHRNRPVHAPGGRPGGHKPGARQDGADEPRRP